MSRQPKPWYRADRKVWCVTINGKRHNLGRKKKEAFEQFFALMQKPRKREAVAETTLPALVDAFLEWNYQNRAEDENIMGTLLTMYSAATARSLPKFSAASVDATSCTKKSAELPEVIQTDAT